MAEIQISINFSKNTYACSYFLITKKITKIIFIMIIRINLNNFYNLSFRYFFIIVF